MKLLLLAASLVVLGGCVAPGYDYVRPGSAGYYEGGYYDSVGGYYSDYYDGCCDPVRVSIGFGYGYGYPGYYGWGSYPYGYYGGYASYYDYYWYGRHHHHGDHGHHGHHGNGDDGGHVDYAGQGGRSGHWNDEHADRWVGNYANRTMQGRTFPQGPDVAPARGPTLPHWDRQAQSGSNWAPPPPRAASPNHAPRMGSSSHAGPPAAPPRSAPAPLWSPRSTGTAKTERQ